MSNNIFDYTGSIPHKLLIDKVCLLLEVEDDATHNIDNMLKRLHRRGTLRKLPRKSNWPRYQQRFRCAAYDPVTGLWNKLVIEAAPLAIDENGYRPRYLKCTYNPAKMDTNHVADIIKIIIGKKLFSTFYRDCVLSRIDFAVDTSGITPRDVLLYVKGCSKAKNYRNPINRVLTGITVGSFRSEKRHSCYDKNEEIEARHSVNLLNSMKVCRFETSLKKRGGLLISELPHIPNIFKDVNFYRSKIKSKLIPAKYIKKARRKGLQHVLVELNRHQRRQLLHNLEKYRLDLFDKNELWEQLPDAVAFLEVFLKKK